MRTQVQTQSKRLTQTMPAPPVAAFQSRPFAAQNESTVGEEHDGSSLFESYLQRRAGAAAAGAADGFGGGPSQMVIQPKLTLGPVRDRYEREADQVAKQVVGRVNGAATQGVSQGTSDRVQRTPAIQSVPTAHGTRVDSGIESGINRARGGGQPLALNVRAPMEQAFGADFGGVRVHTSDHSDRLNRSLQARAFTTGQEIFFRQGAYSPTSSGGQALLAHELTHVVQQNGAGQRIQRVRKSKFAKATVDEKDKNKKQRLQQNADTAPPSVPKAVQIISESSDTEIKKAATAYLHYYKKKTEKETKNSKSSASIESKVGPAAEVKLTKEGVDLLTGITFLVDAQVLTGAGLKIQGAHEQELGPLKGALKASLELFAGTALKGSAKFNIGLATGLTATASAEAKSGIEAKAKGSVEFKINDLPIGAAEGTAEGFVGSKAKAEGTFSVTPDNLSVTGKAEALAGLEGKVSAPLTFKIGKTELLKITPQASAILGAGVKAEGTFAVYSSKIKIKIAGGAAVGVGGSVGVSLEMNPHAMKALGSGLVIGMAKELKNKAGKKKAKK